MWEEREEKEGLTEKLGGMLMKIFNRFFTGGEEQSWSAIPVFFPYFLEPHPQLQQEVPGQLEDMLLSPPQSEPQDEEAEPRRRGRPRTGREVICPKCGAKGIERISVRGEKKYVYVYHGLDNRKVPILHYIGPAEENTEPPAEPDRQPA